MTDFDDLEKLRQSGVGSDEGGSGLKAAVGAIANSQKKSRSGLAWESTDKEVGLVDPEEARRLAGRFDPQEFEQRLVMLTWLLGKSAPNLLLKVLDVHHLGKRRRLIAKLGPDGRRKADHLMLMLVEKIAITVLCTFKP